MYTSEIIFGWIKQEDFMKFSHEKTDDLKKSKLGIENRMICPVH